ncbi:MAG TPA: hypothetical protein VLU25_11755 [Acidobacteriota bacterium]|nr:hypothetical protein [Acidobacteriota bacterium]
MSTRVTGMITVLLLAVLTLPLWAQEEGSAQEGFELMKRLEGEWKAEVDGGESTEVSYRLYSGGTALFEHFLHAPSERGAFASPEQAMMVSAIYVNGGRLFLDHYCTSGTQPRLAARRISDEMVEFEFETPQRGDHEGHIHRAVFRFQDDDHFTSQWTWRDEHGQEHSSMRRHTRQQTR